MSRANLAVHANRDVAALLNRSGVENEVAKAVTPNAIRACGGLAVEHSGNVLGLARCLVFGIVDGLVGLADEGDELTPGHALRGELFLEGGAKGILNDKGVSALVEHLLRRVHLLVPIVPRRIEVASGSVTFDGEIAEIDGLGLHDVRVGRNL